MPRNLVIPDPTANTIGAGLAFVRLAAGAAGVRGELVTTDPDGAFAFTVNQLSAGSQAALVTIYNEAIALMRTARGYV